MNNDRQKSIEICHQHSLQTKKGIIDFVTTKQNSQLEVRVYRGADCRTDLYLVRADVFYLWKTRVEKEMTISMN